MAQRLGQVVAGEVGIHCQVCGQVLGRVRFPVDEVAQQWRGAGQGGVLVAAGAGLAAVGDDGPVDRRDTES